MSAQIPLPGFGQAPLRHLLETRGAGPENAQTMLLPAATQEALLQILKDMEALIPYRCATIQLEHEGALWMAAQRGPAPASPEAASHSAAEDHLYQALLERMGALANPDMGPGSLPCGPVNLDEAGAWMAAPLPDGERVMGMLSVAGAGRDSYTQQQTHMLSAFARQAAMVIQNASLAGRLSRSQNLYQTFQEVVALVNSSLDFDRVLDEVLKQVERVLPYTSASIHLLRANRLYYAAGRGFPGDSHPESELSAGENAIFQQIAATKQPLLLRDVRQHPDWHVKPGLEYIHSWIGAPLIVKGHVIGYLTLDHAQVGAYTREDVHIADTLARQVAVAIENARLYTETRRWAEEQAALNTIATASSSSLDLTKMLNHVLDAVRMLFEVDAADVRLLGDEEGGLYVAARRQEEPAEDVPAGDASVAYQASGDLAVEAAFGMEEDVDSQGESAVAVPLRSKERLLGSLSIISYQAREFTSREISLMEAISYQLSLAIENARLYEQLKESEARKTGLLDELENSLQELQRTQAKLIQSEKLAAVGQLTSGVAHELNNPLTAIIGYAQILEAGNLPASVKSDLLRIIEQAQRSAHIVENLLTFSRQHKPDRFAVDVNQLLEDTLDLVEHQLRLADINVERDLSGDIPLALADPYQLQQVWLNLIQNAHQAMRDSHGGGRLRIQTSTSEQGRIRVEFSDTGPGIPSEVLQKIFDPFFTTKPVGKGTGLGLSICYGIIQEHQGDIWVESNPEGGSTFIVELPGYEGDAGPKRKKEAEPAVPAGPARILLVDDDLAVLELVERYLGRQGYDIQRAQNGLEAMERVEEEEYDLILLDVLMPKQDGMVTYRQITQQRPELAARIIFATGNAADAITHAFLEETGATYIAKPFDLPELAELVQATLEQA
jgi:signal transduction histidine kinase/ActR/RegA family two-component response regulator